MICIFVNVLLTLFVFIHFFILYMFLCVYLYTENVWSSLGSNGLYVRIRRTSCSAPTEFLIGADWETILDPKCADLWKKHEYHDSARKGWQYQNMDKWPDIVCLSAGSEYHNMNDTEYWLSASSICDENTTLFPLEFGEFITSTCLYPIDLGWGQDQDDQYNTACPPVQIGDGRC